jgi:hypothetical protein
MKKEQLPAWHSFVAVLVLHSFLTFVIGLERNGQADDPVERNTTHMRVLKNRFSGITGPAGHLLYDGNTGRLSEFTPPEEEEVIL